VIEIGSNRKDVLDYISVSGSGGGTERGSRGNGDCTGVQHPSGDSVSVEGGASGEGSGGIWDGYDGSAI